MDGSGDSTRSLRHLAHSLVRLSEAPWRWEVGVEAGLAMGVPLAMFTSAGHQSTGLTASMGAFTALYGSTLHRIDRARVLPLIGVGFVVASAIGVLSSGSVWLTAFCLLGIAALATTIALTIGIGPPGAMHFVLVAGISGYMAASQGLAGADVEGLVIPMWVAVGAASAYLVVIAPLLLPAVRRSGEGARLREVFPFVHPNATTALIGGRIVAAVAIASLASVPLGVPRAYWVVMVAGVVLQGASTTWLGTVRAIQRIGGTFLGVGLFTLLAWIRPEGLWLVVVLALLQSGVEVVVARNYGLAMIFITPLALSIATAGRGAGTGIVIRDRILDTLLGAVIAMAVLWSGEWLRRRFAL